MEMVSSSTVENHILKGDNKFFIDIFHADLSSNHLSDSEQREGISAYHIPA